MARFKVWLEYQGTKYRGWQIQQNARTVQGELRQALATVFPDTEFEFQGAGRTDAGVHALLQVAHLDVKTSLSCESVRRRLNDALPADVNILKITPASPRFHARHHAQARSYLYQISRRRTALGKNFVWWVREELDVGAMRQAAALFLGMKDFRSFTDDEPDAKSTRALIENVEIVEEGDLILVRVRGSHFLWKMVRRIIGVLVEVGKGKLTEDDVRSFLKAPSARPAELTAPASGLFLEAVVYEGDQDERPLESVIKVSRPG